MKWNETITLLSLFLNARDLILRAQNAKTIDERKHYMIEASKELNDVINASRLDLKTSSEHLAKLTRFPILRNSSQIKNYMGYVAQDFTAYYKVCWSPNACA